MNTTDVTLVDRIREGDRAAIEQAYDAYFTPVMNFVYYTVYNYHSAQDISQEAFLKVIKAIKDQKKEVRDFKAYLYRTARNMAIDEVRKSKKHADYPLEAIKEEDPNIFSDPERAAMLREQRSQVAGAVLKLNDNQRTALTLKDMEGWSYDDIGGMLGLSRNAVGLLLSRARLKFKREFRLQRIDLEQLTRECRDLLPLMSTVMDGVATGEEKERLKAHLDACPVCRETMSEMKEASGVLRSLIPIAPMLALKAGLVTKAAAVAGAGAAGGAAIAGAGVGMSAATKMIVGAVTSVLIAGAGVGTYIGVKKATQTAGGNPYVRVVLPVNGEEFTRDVDSEGEGLVKIMMEVDNRPHKIELAIDGEIATTLEKGPYSYAWKTSITGPHTVRPTAFDSEGNRYPGDEVTFSLVLEGLTDNGVAYLKNGDIYIARMDGGGESKITSKADIKDFRPSPSGEKIAFINSQDILFLMDSDGDNAQQVTLPEKGHASNPAFSFDGKYIYFTRVTNEEWGAGAYSVRFERYEISANRVQLVFRKDGISDYQSIVGLYLNPAGTEVYFNIFGSQWPGCGIYKLCLGPPVKEELAMPGIRNTGDIDYADFTLMSISNDEKYFAYHKNAALKMNEFAQYACYKLIGTGEEIVLASWERPCMVGGIARMEFSQLEPSVYYFSKVTKERAGAVDLEFYKDQIPTEQPTQTGLEVSNCTINNVSGQPVWHLVQTRIKSEQP